VQELILAESLGGVGETAIETWLTETSAKAPSMKVLRCEPEVKSLEVTRDIAYE